MLGGIMAKVAQREHDDKVQDRVDKEVDRLWEAEQTRRRAAQEVAQLEEFTKCALFFLFSSVLVVIFLWN